MTKFIKLAKLRSIALAADVVCDVAQAIRNSLDAHAGHGDGHLVSVPESISDLIGLAEAEVTKMLVPETKLPVAETDPAVIAPAPEVIAPAPEAIAPVAEVSPPAPEVSPAAPAVSDAPLTPDPVG